MAQPKLEYLSLAVARIVGDEILNMTASSDGNTYTATQRINAINSARQNIYLSLSGQLGLEKFAQEYPEFVKESAQLDVAENIGLIPANVKFVLAVKFKRTREGDLVDPYTEAVSVSADKLYSAMYNQFSPYRTSENDYKYCEINNTIVFEVGIRLVSSYMKLIYLEDLIPVSLGGTASDIPDPDSWRQKTIEEAARILTADEQSKLKI